MPVSMRAAAFAHYCKNRMSTLPCRLRFINPGRCSVSSYEKAMNFRKKSQKDMYGFIRSDAYLMSERMHRSTRIGAMAQLDLDWVEYLKSIGGPANLKPYGTFKPSLALKTLVRRGIPAALRPLIWPFISRTDVYRRDYPDNFYESLVYCSLTGLDDKVKDDIEKDLDRTFPGHDYFSTPEAIMSLRRVLTAFAMKNEQIGYCQSLNFLAGAMLLFMEEESAFWMMCHVVEKVLPPDYYTKTMIGTYVDQFVLAYLIKTTLPKLHVLLQSFEMQLPVVAVEWFMCLFVNTLRPEVAFRVWDIFLNEGAKTLFRIAMALLKRHEPRLLQATDAASLFMTIKEIGIDFVDPDELIQLAYKTHKGPLNTNYSSTKKSSILSSKVARNYGTVILKRNPVTLIKAVPRDLVGIGLAHLGPKALCSRFSVAADTAEEGMTTYVMNVISGHRRPSFDNLEAAEINGALSTAGGAKDDLDCSIMGTPGVRAKGRMVTPFTTSDPLETSEHALHTEIHAKELVPGAGRARKKRDAYRNFGTVEITAWREQFRPEVEARIMSMEHARTAYKQRREILEHEALEEKMKNLSLSRVTDATIVKHGTVVVSSDTPAIAICAGNADGYESDDDGADYDMVRKESIAMSPDQKMHGAAPKLWDMLFQAGNDEEGLEDRKHNNNSIDADEVYRN